MKVLVGYFGITRSLRLTLGSIQRLIRPIRDAGLGVRQFGHFHLPGRISNPRSGEAGIVPDADEAGLLQLDRCLLEVQEPALVADSLAVCRAYPDTYGDGYASVRNLCFQLRSLARLWSLMADEVADEDWVLFLRPDLFYLDALDAAELIATLDVGGCEMAVPRWHGWGGLNDRFALCNAYAAEAYAMRGRHLETSAAETGAPHPESLLAHAVRKAGLRVGSLDVRAVRIRADGTAAARDLHEFGLSDMHGLLAA